MPISHIFLDLDDTLNKFTMQALMEVGCTVDRNDPFTSFNPAWKFNIIQAANALQHNTFFTPTSFWKSLQRDFWATLPRSSEFNILLGKALTLVDRKNISILTCPVEDPDCLAGKLEWIQYYLPAWLHRQYIMTPQKHLLAHCPGALLIDDCDKNIDLFRLHGGQAILVPRPWNSLHGINGEEYLRARFRELLTESHAA